MCFKRNEQSGITHYCRHLLTGIYSSSFCFPSSCFRVCSKADRRRILASSVCAAFSLVNNHWKYLINNKTYIRVYEWVCDHHNIMIGSCHDVIIYRFFSAWKWGYAVAEVDMQLHGFQLFGYPVAWWAFNSELCIWWNHNYLFVQLSIMMLWQPHTHSYTLCMMIINIGVKIRVNLICEIKTCNTIDVFP